MAWLDCEQTGIFQLGFSFGGGYGNQKWSTLTSPTTAYGIPASGKSFRFPPGSKSNSVFNAGSQKGRRPVTGGIACTLVGANWSGYLQTLSRTRTTVFYTQCVSWRHTRGHAVANCADHYGTTLTLSLEPFLSEKKRGRRDAKRSAMYRSPLPLRTCCLPGCSIETLHPSTHFLQNTVSLASATETAGKTTRASLLMKPPTILP